MAQLVAHLLCKQGVRGSSPLGSTHARAQRSELRTRPRPEPVGGVLRSSLAANLPSVVIEPPYTHVVVGDCREVLDYALLDTAFRAVRSGATLVALQRGKYFKRPDGDHVDTGAVIAAIEYAADVTARVVGKPSVDYFQAAASSLGVDLAACVVIGDDATTDIAGGRAAGAVTVQVRTGKFADQSRAGAGEQADVTLDSVADLPGLLVGGW